MANEEEEIDFKPYGRFREETPHQSDNDSAPSVIGQLPYQKEKDVTSQDEFSLHAERSYSNEEAHSDVSKPDSEGYPPGVTITGSRNLPIPEIEPEAILPAKIKRRGKKNSTSPFAKNEAQAWQEPNQEIVKKVPHIPNSKHKPDYIQPAPTVLPPLKAKAALVFNPTAAAIGSAFPAVDKTTRPEPVGKEMNNLHHIEMGVINESFANDTALQARKNGSKAGKPKLQKSKSGLQFTNESEGVQMIDYILAYEEDDKNEEEEKRQEYRHTFETNLEKAGVKLEREPKESSQNGKTCFIKVHVPWDICLEYAEKMKMKMRLKEVNKVEHDGFDETIFTCECCKALKSIMHRCISPYKLNNQEIKTMFGENDFYTAEFVRNKEEHFEIKDKNKFFNTSERSRIAHRIMSKTKYGTKTQIGIEKLVANGTYCAAYPLHEGLHACDEEKVPKDDNLRRMLYWEWARWGRWYKFQPLDMIKYYLSDRIALYFAYMQFYSIMLVVPSVVGAAVLLYGVATLFDSSVSVVGLHILVYLIVAYIGFCRGFFACSSFDLFPFYFEVRRTFYVEMTLLHYLGDKIGIYFAWLGFYTNMLFLPTAIGLLCLIYSVASVWAFPPAQEVCDETFPSYAGNITMCPLCDSTCTYWKLRTSCLAARITYIVDNSSTIFFAVMMSLWATLFLEFWKRRQFRLSYEWDLVDYDEEHDLVRPEYEVVVDRKRLNPVTMKEEPYLHPNERFTRIAGSVVAVVFWVAIIIAAVFAVIVYRIAINTVFAATIDTSSLGAIGSIATPSMLTTITASLISLVVIIGLNKIYEKVALWLTRKELPRTQIEFDDSFTFKMFWFQFVNYYSYLFYIAFFKNTFAGHPASYNYLFGQWRWEECDAGGCMYELSLQLAIIMIGKQFINNFLELVFPWILNKYRQWKSKKATEKAPMNQYTRWEQDYDLSSVENMDLFNEYLEMVIQFGFVTLFVVAFPLAPLFALINNIVEIRLDANKFICEYRRPLAHKCSDIGAWYFLLEFIATLSVVTNAFTIAITSDFIPKLVYFYGYAPSIFGESTYVGFVDNSLSTFNVSDFTAISAPTNAQPFPGESVTECRYRDYRTPPTADPKYALTLQYWHVLAARFAFVIAIEHVVFFLTRLLDYWIPDRPKELKEKIKREHFLVQKMLFHEHAEKSRRESNDSNEQNGSASNTATDSPPSRNVTNENEIRHRAEKTQRNPT